MDWLIKLVAQGGIYLVAAGALLGWFLLPRKGKVGQVVEVIVAFVVMAVLIKVAAAIHTDPRPFVVDPSVHPLFSHAPDNGFPSDHTAVGVTTALVVAARRRRWGIILLVIALAVGSARVLAHVHHWQDIFAGAVIGVIAAAVGVAVWRLVADRVLALEPVRRLVEVGAPAHSSAE